MDPADIFLRPVVDTDVAQFFAHSQDKAAIRMAAPAKSIATWPEFNRQWVNIRSDDAIVALSVVLKGEIAGYIARFEQANLPSISYWFSRRFWGQGLAKHALSLFLKHVGERPLYARVARGNEPSLRVLAANGFSKIGTSSYFSGALNKDIEEIVLRLDA